MKKFIILSSVAAIVAAESCWSESQGYSCCSGCDVSYTDDDGKWGYENNDWCGILDSKCNPSSSTCWSLPDYKCCEGKNVEVVSTDENGSWGIENDEWCGIIKTVEEPDKCWSLPDYQCCKEGTEVAFTDDSGKWGIENGQWCGISNTTTSTTSKKTTTDKTTVKTTKTTSSSSSATVLYPEYEEIECTPPDEFSYGQCCHGEDIEAYGKCGGKDWTGSTCCMVGTSCQEINEYVSLCQPDPTAPIRPATFDKGVHGKEWCKPPNCVVTENQMGYNWGYDVVNDSGCEIPEYECYDLIHKTWGPNEYPVGTTEGVTTRYYDCCKPSCSWPGKAEFNQPVRQCAIDGKTVLDDFSSPSACQTDVVGTSHMCEDQQPWMVSDVLSYGFAAAALPGGEGVSCCACYAITFSEPPIRGKQLVVQVTNTGADVGSNQFDLQIPGGGVGIFDACTNMYGLPAGSNGWGKKYGGIDKIEDCDTFPEELQEGCRWRFKFLLGADNPKMTFTRVKCPAVLTDITGCIRNDEDSFVSEF